MIPKFVRNWPAKNGMASNGASVRNKPAKKARDASEPVFRTKCYMEGKNLT
jgi:hypothetical protein